jgi:hypothetical protein
MNEWQLYFPSLRNESEVQKVVELPHVNVVYKLFFIYKK